jgi:hypothetical protein
MPLIDLADADLAAGSRPSGTFAETGLFAWRGDRAKCKFMT